MKTLAGIFLASAAAWAFAATPFAPVYPGSVSDPVASAAARHARVYLSRAPMSKVRAWYAARLAARSAAACQDPDKGCGRFVRQCETVSGSDAMTRCSESMILKWNAIPPGGSMVDAYNAGVRLEGWLRAPTARPAPSPAAPAAGSSEATRAMTKLVAQMQAAGQAQARALQALQKQMAQASGAAGVDVEGLARIPDMPFSGLKREVLAHRHGEKELDELYRRYRGLATAVYPEVKGPAGPESYAVHEYHRCKSTLAPANEAAATVDHWDDWLACVRRIAAHAYRTRVIIDIAN